MILKEIQKALGTILINSGNTLLNSCNLVRTNNLDPTKVDMVSLEKFWFLADAPLFIDSNLVERLYNSIFRPEFEVASRTKTRGNISSQELSGEISGTVEGSIPTILKISAMSKLNNKSVKTSSHNESLTETTVLSPERRLEKLINLYVYSYPDRLFWINSDLVTISDISGKEVNWEQIDNKLDEAGVRPLVVLDLKANSRIIPMAAEPEKGETVLLYKLLNKELDPENQTNSKYPDHGSKNYENLSKEYWKTLHTKFNSSHAMQIVEKSTKDAGKLVWIDFRLVGFKGIEVIPLHLHLSPLGKYPTGTFGYQFIRRAEKCGVRIVGTLKKGQDVNVLGIYDC